MCKQCNPAFGKIVEGFRKLVHQGSELKKREKGIQLQKHEDRVHYCNIVAQNEWIRGNIFDAMRNYLFCHDCVQKALDVSKQCLSRQRQVQHRLFQQPEREMTKKEVDDQSLTSFVIMPLGIELCFALWWKDLPIDHKVAVRYPYEKHGLAGRVSNNAKADAKRAFLEFVDTNRNPMVEGLT